MTKDVLIAGGGIGGLAAALACVRAGADVRLLERAAEFTEVGAGIQISPNVVHVLERWQLRGALEQVAAFPQHLQVRDALSGDALALTPLGQRSIKRYGWPYATIARADLQQLLLHAVQQTPVQLECNVAVDQATQSTDGVSVNTADGRTLHAQALIGADGLWSQVRRCLLGEAAPRVTGHLAYRAMLPQQQLPERLRSQQITVWLGPRLHLVQYPVRRGEWLNVVGILQGRAPIDPQSWDAPARAGELRAALKDADACTALRDLAGTIDTWRLWALSDRPPISGPEQQARGRIALLGDAAHPMRPYLAQGAGMAIEDAGVLGALLAQDGAPNSLTVEQWLQSYAAARWQRCARVQQRSIRNGQIFHAEGLTRWGRNSALRLLGQQLLDVPWLYRGTPILNQ